MTDRVSTLTVVLSQDMRTDDAYALVQAIGMLSGVASVEYGEPVNSGELVERARIRREVTWESYQKLCFGTKD